MADGTTLMKGSSVILNGIYFPPAWVFWLCSHGHAANLLPSYRRLAWLFGRHLIDTVAAQFPCPCASLNSSATSFQKTQSDPTLGLPTQDSCAWPYAEPWETKQSFLSVDWLDDPPLPEHVGGVEPVRNPAHGVVLARRSMSFPIAPLKKRSADTEGKKTAAPFV